MTFSLEVRWFDDDVVALLARCEGASFAGEAECYAPPTVFRDLAARLRGFPASREDERVVELGTFAPDLAGGGVRLTFKCADSSGHLVADVRIRRPRGPSAVSGVDSAEFAVAFEPAGIDDFVRALACFDIVVGHRVELRGAM